VVIDRTFCILPPAIEQAHVAGILAVENGSGDPAMHLPKLGKSQSSDKGKLAYL